MSDARQDTECVLGLTDQPVEALRYAASNIDPYEYLRTKDPARRMSD